jgi:3-dehydro-L-gulonate 2-dehydrogenase
MQTLRLPFRDIKVVLTEILSNHGFSLEKAERLAHVHTASSQDGVYSHGLNRFAHFIRMVREGYVVPGAEPSCFNSAGAIEQWDGNLGSGIWNATKCLHRAVALAGMHGIACVALRNTNHWMRGGTYGWEAADRGMIAVGITNTKPNMPPWGGTESRTGNNPLVIAVPEPSGDHMVLDMSMSQFSFGKIEQYMMEGKTLPHPGGWDDAGNLSRDPETILKKERGLPIGFWKGSALSIMLDALVTVMSGGKSTYKIGLDVVESGVSQAFICIDPELVGDSTQRAQVLREIIHNIHDVELIDTGNNTRVPGENTLRIRRENATLGIPVEETVWQQILSLRK